MRELEKINIEHEKIKGIIFKALTTGASYIPVPQLTYLTVIIADPSEQVLDGATKYIARYVYQRDVRRTTFWLDNKSRQVVAETHYA